MVSSMTTDRGSDHELARCYVELGDPVAGYSPNFRSLLSFLGVAALVLLLEKVEFSHTVVVHKHDGTRAVFNVANLDLFLALAHARSTTGRFDLPGDPGRHEGIEPSTY